MYRSSVITIENGQKVYHRLNEQEKAPVVKTAENKTLIITLADQRFLV
jgi:hypothetical protein